MAGRPLTRARKARKNPSAKRFEIHTYKGELVWTGSAASADAAMRKFRKESGVGYPNGALYDGNYMVRTVRAPARANPGGRQIFPGDPDYPKKAKPYKFRLGAQVRTADGKFSGKVVSCGRGQLGKHYTIQEKDGSTTTWSEHSLERIKPARKRKNPLGMTWQTTYANPSKRHTRRGR